MCSISTSFSGSCAGVLNRCSCGNGHRSSACSPGRNLTLNNSIPVPVDFNSGNSFTVVFSFTIPNNSDRPDYFFYLPSVLGAKFTYEALCVSGGCGSDSGHFTQPGPIFFDHREGSDLFGHWLLTVTTDVDPPAFALFVNSDHNPLVPPNFEDLTATPLPGALACSGLFSARGPFGHTGATGVSALAWRASGRLWRPNLISRATRERPSSGGLSLFVQSIAC